MIYASAAADIIRLFPVIARVSGRAVPREPKRLRFEAKADLGAYGWIVPRAPKQWRKPVALRTRFALRSHQHRTAARGRNNG